MIKISGCSRSCLLTGVFTSSADVCGCRVNHISTMETTSGADGGVTMQHSHFVCLTLFLKLDRNYNSYNSTIIIHVVLESVFQCSINGFQFYFLYIKKLAWLPRS